MFAPLFISYNQCHCDINVSISSRTIIDTRTIKIKSSI